jgi:hypoxanthine phosphoribosyltransferase
MNSIDADFNKILVTTEQIQARVKKLAEEISRDYADVKQIYLIGVLKGAFIFMADLCRQLTIPHVVDFMAVSSYGKSANTVPVL